MHLSQTRQVQFIHTRFAGLKQSMSKITTISPITTVLCKRGSNNNERTVSKQYLEVQKDFISKIEGATAVQQGDCLVAP